MKICVITLTCSRLAGGLFYSVSELSRAVQGSGDFELEVWCVRDKEVDNDIAQWNGLNLKIYKNSAKIFGARASLAMMVDAAKKDFDLVHIHGSWNFCSIVGRIFMARGVPIVVSPRGMYDPWILGRSKTLKKIFFKTIERKLYSNSAFVHALNDKEAKSVGAVVDCRVTVVPNGVHAVDERKFFGAPGKNRKLIYIGRLHEKKGLVEFLQAWSNVSPAIRSGWIVEIYGWGDSDYVEKINDAIVNGNLGGQVGVKGEVYGEVKRSVLAEASAFFLPTKSEGLPMAILEAWSFGLPTLMTDDANLSIGFDRLAATRLSNVADWSVDISNFLSSFDGLSQIMSDNAIQLVSEKYLWASVGKEMADKYLECIS